ncbi:chromosome condensation protein CrcB [Actinomyces sp. Z5]|uniref:chromosome condensation protein CrcB n=1 Tax=Actinomyces sp. Z5 TaxID=2250216 RepID=UPI000DCE87E5|nr:chromosome condensation protein CrcB [Actinomyces sp. Z5]RAX19248.1 chromosome condensation protein CrcB [Actinomyces sp. Z5]
MSTSIPPLDIVELDDAEMSTVDGGTSLPCAGLVITTMTTCFNDTALWGSCRLGTRGCC